MCNSLSTSLLIFKQPTLQEPQQNESSSEPLVLKFANQFSIAEFGNALSSYKTIATHFKTLRIMSRETVKGKLRMTMLPPHKIFFILSLKNSLHWFLMTQVI